MKKDDLQVKEIAGAPCIVANVDYCSKGAGMKSCRKFISAKVVDAADTVAQRYAAFLADPDDPETNHKLRVSIRTLRSLVDFLSPWQKPKQNDRVQKNLKRVVRRTSRLRELDVLCAMAHEAGASEELVSFCTAKAADERAAVHESLMSSKFAGPLEVALEDASTLRWKRSIRRKGLKPKEVRARYDELASRLQADLETLDEDDYELMHDMRKRAKQVRYVSEQFEEILGADAAKAARRMKDEQDRLGALCDAKVNREIVAAFIAQEDLSPALAADLRQLAQ